MSDTTALDDLPSAAVSEQNKEIANEIVSGIQQASMNGGLELPNRDIPTNTLGINSDIQTTPNYIPSPSEDYISSHETSETVLNESRMDEKRMDNFNYLYDKAHIYLLIAFLYFIFQLPVFSKSMMRYLPFCFGDDKNLNLQGVLTKSVLFALVIFSLSESINYVSNL